MQDGYTQSGAGASDMRVGGKDLQHARQHPNGQELHEPVRRAIQMYQDGGPMKRELDREMQRHRNARMERLADLKDHYTR